jgi:hypothetical protein
MSIFEKIDALRQDGWSYHVGYNQQFKAYQARIWRDRDKPLYVKTKGGGTLAIMTECIGALGLTIEEAISLCLEKKNTDNDRVWFDIWDKNGKIRLKKDIYYG